MIGGGGGNVWLTEDSNEWFRAAAATRWQCSEAGALLEPKVDGKSAVSLL